MITKIVSSHQIEGKQLTFEHHRYSLQSKAWFDCDHCGQTVGNAYWIIDNCEDYLFCSDKCSMRWLDMNPLKALRMKGHTPMAEQQRDFRL